MYNTLIIEYVKKISYQSGFLLLDIYIQFRMDYFELGIAKNVTNIDLFNYKYSCF